MKKYRTWAVVDDNFKIIKAGFPTSAAAYEWNALWGAHGLIVRVWI